MRKIDADALQKAMEFVTNDPSCPIHIAANIDQIIDYAPTVDDWILCKERMPENHDDVLVCSKRGSISIAWYSEGMHRYYVADSDASYDEADITRWMPLPKPPKEVDEDGTRD